MFRLIATRNIIRGPLVSSLRCRSTQAEAAGGRGIGVIALGVGLGSAVALTGTAVYAQLNPEFKKLLVENVPLSGTIFKPKETENLIEEMPKKIGTVENNLHCIEVENPTKEASESPLMMEEEKSDVTTKSEVLDAEEQIMAATKSLMDLQASLGMACLAAVSTYSLAAQAVRGLTDDLDRSADKLSNSKVHQPAACDNIVLRLLEKNRAGQEMVRDAGSSANLARTQMDTLQEALSGFCSSGIVLPDEVVKQVESSLSEAQLQLQEAEDFLKQALTCTGPPVVLQRHVAQVTADLEEDLGFSFVGSGNSEQRENFLKTLAGQLLQQRKEVEHKVATHQKLTSDILAARGAQGVEIRLEALTQAKEEELRHMLREDNYQQVSTLRKQLEHDTSEELYIQQWHSDEAKKMALKNKRAAFDRELAEQWNIALTKTIANQEYFIENLKKARPNLKQIELEIKQSSEALILSTVSHAMVEALKTDPFPQLDWTHQIQPIEHFLDTIENCGITDKFVRAVTHTLPAKAINRGVYSMNALKKRFYEMEKMARKVTMLKEKDGNPLVLYLVSYLRSFMLLHPVTVVSLSEKTNQPLNLGRLNNEAILDRAKFFMEQGDFQQAVSYVNMLQGVSQHVASGWSQEMYLHLEVLQAAQTLSAFSALLVHHTIADPPPPCT